MPEITIQQAMQIARQHHQAGQLADAEAMYRLVLSAQVNHAGALHMLGVLAAQTNRAELAVDLLRRAVASNPEIAEFHSDLGSALSQFGRHDEATDAFRRAVSLSPADANFHFNLGTALGHRQQYADAIAAYKRAIALDPHFVSAWCNLGVTLNDSGQIDEAITAFRRALEIDPAFHIALNNLGKALADKGDLDHAIDACQQALALKPDHAPAHVNLGHALAEIGRLEEATASYRQALRFKPAYPEAFINLGNVLRQQRRYEDAISAYQQALGLDPDNVKAMNNLGVALHESGQTEGAIAAYHKAIHLKPDYVEAHYNLGNALSEKGLFDEPMAAYQQALRLKSDSVEAHWNMGLHLLLHGHFEAGWREHEWRWQSKHFISTRHEFSQPQWDGSDPRGRTILLYHEQGFGDTIQFVRYARSIAEKGGRVLVHCPGPLSRLLAGAAGVAAVVNSDPIPPFDLQCPMMTLPLLHKTRLESIPADIPYLKVDATLIETWSGKLRRADDRLKVGVAWAGQPIHRNDYKRSMSLAQLAPLASASQAVFYSLQRGPAAEQALRPPTGIELIDVSADLHDFADTAACIANLDLIIAVDTAVAHLAGALGKPVWVLLPFKPDWRWLLGRDDSPWYPTMRLFRQKQAGDWAGAIDGAAQALRTFTSTSAPDILRKATADHEAGRLDEAFAAYRTVLTNNPENAEALRLSGIVEMQRGHAEIAVALIKQAIARNPSLAKAHVNLGNALAAKRDFDGAIEAFRQAIRLKNDYPQAHNNLGIAFMEQRRYDAAAGAYREAIRLKPTYADAYSNLGNALSAQDRFDEAIAAYRKALVLEPKNAEAHQNLGWTLHAMGEFDQAEAAHLNAIEANPRSAQAHFNRAVLQLARGDFARGWAEYEWRLQLPDAPPLWRKLTEHRWDGGDPRGRTILLHHEQGFGDSIQFVRYARNLAEKGARVVVHCSGPLARLLAGAAGVAAVATADPIPHFDLHCPMLSLPMLFGTRLESIPADVPYLKVDEALVETWRGRLRRDDHRLKVGLVWAGHAIHREDRIRSLPLAQFAPLAANSHAAFYSLQKGAAADQVLRPPSGMELIDLGPDLHDFADTAACISNLDLVIAVDTAVAHLAGALGKPVWLLLPHKPDWRWLLEREDSPWYPTIRLFRQKRPGDWTAVIERIAEAMEQ